MTSMLRISASCTSSLFKKSLRIHSVREALDAFHRYQNVAEVIDDAKSFAYTGAASERTALRNESGSAFGVNTSTETPNRRCNST